MFDARVRTSVGGDASLPGLADALRVWFRIGLLSFGGPASQIALMHREIVEQRRWVSDRRFLQALNFCMLLPGPEAQQLATYLGWLMHGVKGGPAAGLLFILPGAAVMLALSGVYVAFGGVPFVAALFFGLKCAVLALVLEALLRVARKALAGAVSCAVAGAAFAALFVFAVPFPLVVIAALALVSRCPAHSRRVATAAAAPGIRRWTGRWPRTLNSPRAVPPARGGPAFLRWRSGSGPWRCSAAPGFGGISPGSSRRWP
jgi:chromate transporter